MNRRLRSWLIGGVALLTVVGTAVIWDKQGSAFWETWRWPWTEAASSDLVVRVDETENCLYEGAVRFAPDVYYVEFDPGEVDVRLELHELSNGEEQRIVRSIDRSEHSGFDGPSVVLRELWDLDVGRYALVCQHKSDGTRTDVAEIAVVD